VKKTLTYIFITLFLIIGIFVIQNYPASSSPKNFKRLSDTSRIRSDLESIINTPKTRNYLNTDILDSVASYIKKEFSKCSERVSFQNFEAYERPYKNVIASLGPEGGERIIVGAHYDVCGDQDGADDNASGVAGLLELARLLKDKELKYRIDLVAYSLEEPPFFGTENMGSYVHAKSLHDAKIPVKGMVSLEMIGYYSDEKNSQDYPVGFLKWFYGNKGNYITIVQKPFNGSFSRQFKKLSFQENSILTKSFKAPSFIGGIDLSDHRNYWKFGYSAVMITNTAFYRDRNYHTTKDILSNLDVSRIGLVVDGVFRTLMELK
jgi:hypothetical protein